MCGVASKLHAWGLVCRLEQWHPSKLSLCRKVETEADAVGIQLAAKACYKPSGAVGAFEKLAAAEKKEGVKIPQLLRTHPLSEVNLRLIPHC